MANSINPTNQQLSILSGLVKIYVSNYNSVKKLFFPATASINGTQYIPLLDIKTGTTYTVPALTKLQIWGIQEFEYTAVTSYTLIKFGYADDTLGTNFVQLLDLFAIFGGGVSSSDNLNIITGLLSIPAGKIPIMKTTSGATSNTILIDLLGLEVDP